MVPDNPVAVLQWAASDNQAADSPAADFGSRTTAAAASNLEVDRPAVCTPKASRAVRIVRRNPRLWGSGCIRSSCCQPCVISLSYKSLRR